MNYSQTYGYSPVSLTLPQGEARKDAAKITAIKTRRIERARSITEEVKRHKADGVPMSRNDQQNLDNVVLKTIEDLDLPKSPSNVISLCREVITIGSLNKSTENNCTQLGGTKRRSTLEICRDCVAKGQNAGCPNYRTKAFFRAIDIVNYQKQHYSKEER